MLVLSRKANEAIRIGDECIVTVISIRGDKVRLGIDAPQSLAVHRQEVYEAIQRERAEGVLSTWFASCSAAPGQRTKPKAWTLSASSIAEATRLAHETAIAIGLRPADLPHINLSPMGPVFDEATDAKVADYRAAFLEVGFEVVSIDGGASDASR